MERNEFSVIKFLAAPYLPITIVDPFSYLLPVARRVPCSATKIYLADDIEDSVIL